MQRYAKKEKKTVQYEKNKKKYPFYSKSYNSLYFCILFCI